MGLVGAACATAAVLALAGTVAGCGGEHRTPGAVHLLDGSAPAPAPHVDGLGAAAVRTEVQVLRTPGATAKFRDCLHDRFSADVAPGRVELAVERTGVEGRSLAFRVGRVLYVCDGASRFESREPARRWCGGAVWAYPREPLLDPRLDIAGCLSRAGKIVAFAWIVPSRAARWLTVDGDGYTEIYETAAGLPVRVTSGEVRQEQASAEFRVAQYAAGGRRLSRLTLVAHVAG